MGAATATPARGRSPGRSRDPAGHPARRSPVPASLARDSSGPASLARDSSAGQFEQGPWGQGPFGGGPFGSAQPGQAPYAEGIRSTGPWQAAGAAPGQEWSGAGRPPYAGQPYAGPQYGEGADGPGSRNTGAFGRVGSPVIRQRDSALPDPPPGGGRGPLAAIETDNIAALARDLRVLRAKAGLDYPEMAEKSHYTMRTLASAAGGLRLPTLPVLIAYVNACGGDVAVWEDRWGKLTKSAHKGQAALPAGGPGSAAADQAAPGAVPPGARQTGEIYVITSAKQRDAPW